MIGGVDKIIAIPGISPEEALSFLVRCIRRQWTCAIVQDVLSGIHYESFAEIPFSLLREIFVYRNFESLESWDTLGADPSNVGSMLHLLAESDQLTLVSDDAADPFVQIVITEAQGFVEHRGWAYPPLRQVA